MPSLPPKVIALAFLAMARELQSVIDEDQLPLLAHDLIPAADEEVVAQVQAVWEVQIEEFKKTAGKLLATCLPKDDPDLAALLKGVALR